MRPHAHGHSVRKVCRHGWRAWPKCQCAWYFSFKARTSGRRYRFSLDAEIGKHFESKTDAEKAANAIREAILDGTFERAADRRAREQHEAVEARLRAEASTAATAPVTLEQLGRLYFRQYISKKTGERLSSNERLRWDLLTRMVIERRNGFVVAFGDVPVVDVTRHDIEAFRRAHLEPRLVSVTNCNGHTYTARAGRYCGRSWMSRPPARVLHMGRRRGPCARVALPKGWRGDPGTVHRRTTA